MEQKLKITVAGGLKDTSLCKAEASQYPYLSVAYWIGTADTAELRECTPPHGKLECGGLHPHF